jgi:hypothetical protein
MQARAKVTVFALLPSALHTHLSLDRDRPSDDISNRLLTTTKRFTAEAYGGAHGTSNASLAAGDSQSSRRFNGH